MNNFELIFLLIGITVPGFLLFIVVDKIYNFVEKKLYKKPFYKYTASDCIDKLGISEEEYLLLENEIKQHRLIHNQNDNNA